MNIEFNNHNNHRNNNNHHNHHIDCDDNIIREFELLCATKCQNMQQSEFKNWLLESYVNNYNFNYNHNHLTAFAYKIGYSQNITNNISGYIDTISNYIYRTYRYNYINTLNNINNTENTNQNLIDDNHDYSDMPDLMEIDNDEDIPDLIDDEDDSISFDEEITSFLNVLRNREVEDQHDLISNMEASLLNDISSALLFEEIRRDIYKNRLLKKKFNISLILDTINTNTNNTNNTNTNNTNNTNNNTEQIYECSICLENYNKDQFVILNCGHEFCKDCTKKTIRSDKRSHPCCAFCRKEVTKLISMTDDVHSYLSDLIV